MTEPSGSVKSGAKTPFSDIPEDPYDFQHVPKYRGGNRVTRNPLNPRPARAIKLPSIRASASGASPDADAGYWNLVVGACLLLWLLYIVAHNELQTWAGILFWSPAPAVQVASTSTTPPGSAAAVAAGTNVAGQAATGASQAGALGLPSWLGGLSGGLQGGILSGPGLISAIPNAVTGQTGPGTASPATPSGSGPGGMLGSGFWNGPAGSMLKRFGFGK
jgi:hypothetical protein